MIGTKVYQDKTQAGSADIERGTAVHDFTYSVVPTAGGTLTPPEVTVNWFDTVTEEPRVATLPAETITLEDTAAAAPSRPTNTVMILTAPEIGIAPQQDSATYHAMIVACTRIVAIAAGLLRSLYRLRRQSGAAAPGTASRVALCRIEAGCKTSDRIAAYAVVLAWLWAAADDMKSELAVILRRFPGLDRWAELEAREYASASAATWHGSELLRALRAAHRQLLNGRLRRRAAILPPLYGPHKAAFGSNAPA